MRSRWALRAGLAALAAGGALAGTAVAAGTVTKHATATFTVAAGRTRTLYVGFPDALKFGGATYFGTARILAPAPGARGTRPSLARVRILARGEALGGSDYRIVVRNGNGPGTAAVRVRITAVTREPAMLTR